MRIWKCALTGSVLTAMVFAPKQFEEAPKDRAAKTLFAQGDTSLASIPVAMPIRVPANLPARSPITALGSAYKPLRGIRICIDPGHGGQARWSKTHYTGGTVGVVTGQTESDVNLRVSLMLRQYLEAAGAEIVMTRLSDDRCTQNCDKQPELDFRTNLANARGADLFISVHHNDAGRSPTNYSAVFYPNKTMSSITLAENIARSLNMHMGVPSVGAKPGDYRVLDRIRMPGVIVEASFLTCADEDRRLQQLSYNKLEAKAIATGIMNYFRLSKGQHIDFRQIFAPIDDQAGSAQMLADASLVRRQIVERRSLFGVAYEELTYDARGQVTGRREIGGNSTATRAVAKAKTTVRVAASSVRQSASKAGASVKSAAQAGRSTTKKLAATAKKSPPRGKRRG